MLSNETLRLVERLRRCAELWSDASGASLATLGRNAINDSSFFNRLDSPRGPTTATLEQFARFLGDEANWPERQVPVEVLGFLHAVGVSAEPVALSPGKAGENSPRAAGVC